MNLFSIFTKADWLMLKWQIAFGVVAVMLAAGMWFGVDYLTTQSMRDMTVARVNFNSARTRVEQIEEEETTIIEFIGRYQELSRDGIVEDEDRLQFFETIAEIRAANDLFPVPTSISEQLSMPLRYPPEETDPGGPINLRSSVAALSLPLLHEEDLTRLINGILGSPGLYQMRNCNIQLQNVNNISFIVLAQHFNASCELLWYTFDLDPPVDQSLL